MLASVSVDQYLFKILSHPFNNSQRVQPLFIFLLLDVSVRCVQCVMERELEADYTLIFIP
jgi:hypothetical protein